MQEHKLSESERGRFHSIPLVGTALTFFGLSSVRDQHNNRLSGDIITCASGVQGRLNEEVFTLLYRRMASSSLHDQRIDGETVLLGNIPSPLQVYCQDEPSRSRPRR